MTTYRSVREAAFRVAARLLSQLSRQCVAALLVAPMAFAATDAVATNNSAFVSQNVPATMALGQTYQISVTMQNTGDTTWDAGSLYRLGAQAPQDNATWGLGRVELPAPVAPGASVTFNFTVTAPTAVGIYNFQWRMVQDAVEWFGAYTENVAIRDGVNNAVFVSQNVPSTMTPGQSVSISVTMQNAGNTTWTPERQYRLGAQNPQDNATWGAARVELPNAVAPGETVTFNFNVTAPATVGTYNLQWQMVEEFVEWFGGASTNVAVRDGVNNAGFVSQSALAATAPGQTFPVSVTMRNAGTTTWAATSLYRLGSQNAEDNNTWGSNRIELPSSVAPGESVTFNFSVTAPARVGVYNFQWQMVQDNVEWFGDFSTNIAVTDGVNSALFVSQVAPNVVTPGQTYPVIVTMTNTGNTTWTSGNLYRLGSQNAQDNTVWGLGRVELPNDVAPGASVTFNFNIVAPSAMGTYNLQWRMVQDFVEWFGADTDNVAVKDGTNDAVVVSESVPSSMTAGQTYPVSVTVQNTGTSTWSTDNLYRLGSQNPQDNATWGLGRVELPGPVPPGASVTFNFSVAAPSAVGSYNFQWRMVEDNVEWFGGYADNVAVNVQAGVANTGNLAIALNGFDDGQTLFEGTGVDLNANASGDANGITSLEIRIDGAFVANTTFQSQLLFGWSPLTVGVHTVTASAIGGSGTAGQVTKTVNVIVDPQDIPIRTVLQGFRAALAAGDKATAMSFLSPKAQSEYSSAIDVLMPQWPQIVSSWSDPRRMSMTAFGAEYAVTRMWNGTLKIYVIGLTSDGNGNWLLDSM